MGNPRNGNPDLRRVVTPPAPSNEELETRLPDYLSPVPESHLGVACESREEVDRLCNQAQSEGILLKGLIDSPPPVGYWAYMRDPDGHTLEISYGQEVESVMKSQSNG